MTKNVVITVILFGQDLKNENYWLDWEIWNLIDKK